jgi:glycosyltransferase involved in cell wall biosynthesis
LDISHAVTWTGFREDISRLLAAMDIYIQPSNNEGLSLSLLEGMAAGKPVIATDVGGTSEVIVDGKTGLLIPANSTKAISSAILKLLRNPDLCNYLSREARECVINEFDMQKMMKSYAFLYKELLTSL